MGVYTVQFWRFAYAIDIGNLRLPSIFVIQFPSMKENILFLSFEVESFFKILL